MKCLRCGREMGNADECSCGHFYETNLNGKRPVKKNKKKDKHSITLIEVLAIIIVLYVLIMILYSNLKGNKNNNERNDYCDMVCEGSNYTIEFNRCVCSNGEKYTIDK